MLQAFKQLVLALLGTHGRRAWTLVALSVAGSFFAGAGVALLLPLLRAVGIGAGGEGDRLSQAVAGAFHAVGLQPSLASVLVLYCGVALLQALLQQLQTVEATRLTEDFARSWQEKLFRAVERARWDVLLGARSSDLLHAATVDLRRVSTSVRTLPMLGANLLVALVYLVLAGALAPALTAGMAAVGLALLLLVRGRSSLAFRTGTELGRKWKDQTGDLEEYLEGFKIARCYGASEGHRERLVAASREVAGLITATTVYQATAQTWFRVASVAVLAVLVYGAVEYLALPPAELLVLLYVFSRVVPLFSQSEQLFSRVVADVPAFTDLGAIIRRLEANPEQASPVSGPPVPVREAITLTSVRYHYPSGGGRGVQGVNLRIPAGEITALMGPSGAGKTTVIDLLLGLLEPSEGEIAVDGEPLAPERLAAWRAGIGYVTQETWLFHDTLRANLLWARPEAAEEDLWRALDQASAGFVRDLPEGLDTVAGDRGARLSGGERQRIALARAFLRNPSLLVLDEPTSSLDEEAEERIMDVVAGLKGKVTVFLVTHRQSCAARADRTYRIEEGSLAG